mgnify:CR=1 FL=1
MTGEGWDKKNILKVLNYMKFMNSSLIQKSGIMSIAASVGRDLVYMIMIYMKDIVQQIIKKVIEFALDAIMILKMSSVGVLSKNHYELPKTA